MKKIKLFIFIFIFLYILTLFSKIFFDGSDFGSSKTFFPRSNSCAGSHNFLSTWVQVTRSSGYYPPNRVPARHWLKAGVEENRQVFSGGGELKASRVYFGIHTLQDTPPRPRRQLRPLPPVLSPSCLSLLQKRAFSLSLSLSLSSCLFIKSFPSSLSDLKNASTLVRFLILFLLFSSSIVVVVVSD